MSGGLLSRAERCRGGWWMAIEHVACSLHLSVVRLGSYSEKLSVVICFGDIFFCLLQKNPYLNNVVHLKCQFCKKQPVTIVVRNFHLIILKSCHRQKHKNEFWLWLWSNHVEILLHPSIFLNITESKETVILHLRQIFLGDFPNQLILLFSVPVLIF